MAYIFEQIRKKKFFFICLFFILVTGAIWLFIAGKAATFIALNGYHASWLNIFFINYTYLGDGIFAIIIVALCFFVLKKKQEGWAQLIAYLSSGLVAQIIKNIFSAARPKAFFEPGKYLYFIDNITLSNTSSLPSGHTATAFALATVLALYTENKGWQLLVLLGAVLVGYSRIYLGQHFLSDVLLGAFIGSICAPVSVWAARNISM